MGAPLDSYTASHSWSDASVEAAVAIFDKIDAGESAVVLAYDDDEWATMLRQ